MKRKRFFRLAFIFIFISAMIWWGSSWTISRTIYRTINFIITTDPPLPNMVEELGKQMECAKELGFTIRRPILRAMKQQAEPGQPIGLAYRRPNLIILAPNAPHTILAHELGHVIDVQTNREGHPIFEDEKVKNLSLQPFANFIKEMILSECYP